MIFTDTHTHLYVKQFNDDRKEALERCFEAGIQRLFLPNIDVESIDAVNQLAEDYPAQCFPMMGLHPCSVKEGWQSALKTIRAQFDQRKYCAVGEIGIDLYWDKTTLSIQVEAFKQQIEWAKEMQLPIVIHARESFDEIFEVLDEVNDERLRGIFHCFTGTVEQGHRVIDYGDFFLGIGGVVTFKNAGLDKTVAELPLEKLVLETDAPYLAPKPYRGKRNESSYLLYVAEKIAEIQGKRIEEIAEVTTANSKTIFGI